MSIVVADSSPLIALSRIGRLELLREMFGHLLIPKAVSNEVSLGGVGKPGIEAITNALWIERREVSDISLVSLLQQNLGAGESEAIALAKEVDADVVLIDERLGRSAAKRLGLSVTGIVGVLIEARERGLLHDASEVIAELRTVAGFWISDELKQLVIGSVDAP